MGIFFFFCRYKFKSFLRGGNFQNTRISGKENQNRITQPITILFVFERRWYLLCKSFWDAFNKTPFVCCWGRCWGWCIWTPPLLLEAIWDDPLTRVSPPDTRAWSPGTPEAGCCCCWGCLNLRLSEWGFKKGNKVNVTEKIGKGKKIKKNNKKNLWKKMIYNYHSRGSKIKTKAKTNTCSFLQTNSCCMLREKYYKIVSYLFTYIVWVNNLNKKKLVNYLNISNSRFFFGLPLISCLFTKALSVNELPNCMGENSDFSYLNCIEYIVGTADGNYGLRRSWCPLGSWFPENLFIFKHFLEVFCHFLFWITHPTT